MRNVFNRRSRFDHILAKPEYYILLGSVILAEHFSVRCITRNALRYVKISTFFKI